MAENRSLGKTVSDLSKNDMQSYGQTLLVITEYPSHLARQRQNDASTFPAFDSLAPTDRQFVDGKTRT